MPALLLTLTLLLTMQCGPGAAFAAQADRASPLDLGLMGRPADTLAQSLNSNLDLRSLGPEVDLYVQALLFGRVYHEKAMHLLTAAWTYNQSIQAAYECACNCNIVPSRALENMIRHARDDLSKDLPTIRKLVGMGKRPDVAAALGVAATLMTAMDKAAAAWNDRMLHYSGPKGW